MSYNSMTVATALSRVNQSLFLPAIQRPYIWKPTAIVDLFDSLMQGFPISSFLFWSVSSQNRRRWSIYKFEEQHQQGGSWNNKVEPDGRDVVFVLDGQQRLTSLLIGLRGSYTQRERYGRRDKATSYRAHHLYIDLFKDPEDHAEDDEVTANRYAFKFADVAPRSNHRHLWMKVGDILDLESDARLASYRDKLFASVPDRVGSDQLDVAGANLTRLHNLIWLEQPISYYTEQEQDLDRVLAIFIRANEGGTKLSKADLLMSVVTTTWGENWVRDEILGLVDRLNKRLGAEFSFDKDLVMRACLVIPDLPAVYNVGNFTAHNMSIIRQTWDLIRSSLEGAVALAARFGLNGSSLSSMNVLIPIAYYLSKIDGHRLDGTSLFDSANRERIRRWLFSSLFNGAFGGNSDQTIGVCRDTIRETLRQSRNFPLQQLADEMRTRRGRYLAFDDEGIKKLLQISYGQRHTTLALGMLYDGRQWVTTRYHVDHIIPQAAITERALRSRGVPGALIERIRASTNRLGNLQLLTERDNLHKSDQDFAHWLTSRDTSCLEQHLIPQDADLWQPEAFLEFLDAREDLIRTSLRRYLVSTLR